MTSKVKVARSCPTLCNSMDYTVHGILQARKRVGSLSLLQGIFPTQGSNPGLPHCRRILYQLSHKGSPRILEWVAYPFSRGSSQPRNLTGVSCIAGRFFTNWSITEAQFCGRKFSMWRVWVGRDRKEVIEIGEVSQEDGRGQESQSKK